MFIKMTPLLLAGALAINAPAFAAGYDQQPSTHHRDSAVETNSISAPDAADGAVTVVHTSFVDKTRPIKPSQGFAGTPDRRLDVTIWYPAQIRDDHAHPLIIYSHGTYGFGENTAFVGRYLAARGYVFVAPEYPLTSSHSFTKVPFADATDVVNQPRDIHFLIDTLLADARLGPSIDPHKIGVMGHSLGAVTSYFAVFGQQTRDPRIAAAALLGAGDPVQAALSQDMGLGGTWHANVPVPTLFLSAEKDVFARITGGAYAAYARIGQPKYEVMIQGGVHTWFHDQEVEFADHKNPDCLFFEKHMPNAAIPGCEERVPLIGLARQHEITLAALGDFFDAYLQHDGAALVRLRQLDKQFSQVTLSFADASGSRPVP